MFLNDIENDFFNPSPVYKNVRTGDISNKIYDVLKKSPLEMNDPAYIIKNTKNHYRQKNCNMFVFKNIQLVPYIDYQPSVIKNLYNTNKPTKVTSTDYFVQGLIDCLYQTVVESWNSNDFNLILHSSGYDSRIISFLIMKMKKEGINLGNLKFFCHGKESKFFKKIMKYEGWGKDNYFFIDNPDSKFRFNFSNCYKITNGAVCSPVHALGSYFYTATNSIGERNQKITVWTCRFFTEIFNSWQKHLWAFDGNFINFFDKNLFNSRFAQVSVFPADKIVFPALGYRVLDFLSNHYIERIVDKKFISKKICQELDEGLVKLKRHVPRNTGYGLSKGINKIILKQYRKSFYGKYLKNELKLSSHKCSDWCHWTCGGMIEYLNAKNNK